MNNRSIGIIEDDEGIVYLLKKKLKNLGYDTIFCTTGLEALKIFSVQKVDLLIVDFRLPDMTGDSLISKLREESVKTPFIVTTALGDEKIAAKFLKLGAMDYIIKDELFFDLLSSSVKRIMDQLNTNTKLVGTEKALLHSEERAKAIFNNASAGISVVDLEGNPIATNEAYYKLFGYNSLEFKQIKIFEHIHKQDLEIFKLNFIKIKNREISSFRMERYCIRKNLSHFWIDVSVTPMYDSKNKVESIMEVIVDITDRKKAEESLKELNLDLEKKVEDRTTKLKDSNKRLTKYLEKFQEDEKAGKSVQFKLLPENELSFDNYKFSYYIQPSLYLSGDFIDYFLIDKKNIGFYMVDVAGHGVSSAFVTVLIKSHISTILRDHRQHHGKKILDPSAVLSSLNKELKSEGLGKHATIFYGIINLNSNILTYSTGAQFPHPYMLTDKTCHHIPIEGAPIGMFEGALYENYTIQLENNFSFCIFSDGILEILPQLRSEDKFSYLKSLFTKKDTKINDLIKNTGIDKTVTFPDDITMLLIQKTE